MKKSRRKRLVILCIALVCIIVLVFLLFSKSTSNNSTNPPLTDVLTDSISRIVSACPGEIGVAIIINNTDTVKVNDKSVYPMMSVFKVHQALALCNDFDNILPELLKFDLMLSNIPIFQCFIDFAEIVNIA